MGKLQLYTHIFWIGCKLFYFAGHNQSTKQIFQKIWENSKKGKLALVIAGLMALSFVLMRLFGIYSSKNEVLQQVSFGMLVLGIGLIGMLKASIEMFENHRLDKKTTGKYPD